MAAGMLIPLVTDLLLAHRRHKKDSSTGPASTSGLYRAIMTFGIIWIVGTVVLYVIFLNFAIIIANISSAGQQILALTNALSNLSSILGTALASVIAFYFGTRASERGEKASERQGGPSTDTIPPEVTNTSPTSGSTGVQVNSPIIATFSEPIRSSTITPNTFYIKDHQGNRATGIITISEDKKIVTFTPEPSLKGNNTEYTYNHKGGN
jgi:hypothetical protein